MTALLARSAPAATDPKQASSSTYESVQDYYGKVLAGSKDLKTSACSGSKPALPVLEAVKLVPEEVLARFYGCGAPLPLGIDGLTVLDLGSGSGRAPPGHGACILSGHKHTLFQGLAQELAEFGNISLAEESVKHVTSHPWAFVRAFGTLLEHPCVILIGSDDAAGIDKHSSGQSCSLFHLLL